MRALHREIPFLDLATLHSAARERLDAAWTRVLERGRFVGGPEVETFETRFAGYCEARTCVGVGNGTDALELVLAGLGIGRADEVIVPANTFVATVEAICAVGARPRFVDVEPGSLLVDPCCVEAAITPATAAVVAVHLYGQMADMPRLRKIADTHGLALVEDAAQAHGARFAGRRAGSIGDAATFSFYPGKNLGALGDGGAVVTSDDALARRVRSLADHGRGADRHHHDARGRNSRLDVLQAAVLDVKLDELDEQNDRRRRAMARYAAALAPSLEPLVVDPAAEAVHHLAVVRVDDRDRLTGALDRAGVGWGLHYPVPCHRQKPYAEFAEELPVVEWAAGHIVSLPMFPDITADQIARVCAVAEAGLS